MSGSSRFANGNVEADPAATGAQHGLYEKNVIEDCSYGMTFGHSDSDNLIRDNDIRRSGEAGIHFRGGNKAFAPHRNRFERTASSIAAAKKALPSTSTGKPSQSQSRKTSCAKPAGR